jgi:hypothetical protein
MTRSLRLSLTVFLVLFAVLTSTFLNLGVQSAAAATSKKIWVDKFQTFGNTPSGGDLTVQFELHVNGYKGKTLSMSLFARKADGKFLMNGKDYVASHITLTPRYDQSVFRTVKLTLYGRLFPPGKYSWQPHLQVNVGNETAFAQTMSGTISAQISDPTKAFRLTINRMQVLTSEHVFGDELYMLGAVIYVEKGVAKTCVFSTGVLTDNKRKGTVNINQSPCPLRTQTKLLVYVEILDQDNVFKPPSASYRVLGTEEPIFTKVYTEIIPGSGVKVLTDVNVNKDALKKLGKDILKVWLGGMYGHLLDDDDTLYKGAFVFYPGQNASVEFGCTVKGHWFWKSGKAVANAQGQVGYAITCTGDMENQSTVISASWTN